MTYIKIYAAVMLQIILSLFPVNRKKVFVVNHYGSGYGDNTKYVCEDLLKTDNEIKIIWAIKGKNSLENVPGNIYAARFYSIGFFYHLCTSGIWISNVRLPIYFRKRKKQYYVQLWHGGVPLKRIEKDAESVLSPNYIKGAKHDSHMVDLFVSGGKFTTEMYKRAFWYEGRILECGEPRLKPLLQSSTEIKKIICGKAGVSIDTRIALYAPTFRNDFSYYADMYELLAATDLLITDYSSLMFEAGLAKKWVILFAADIEKYLEDRNF